MTQKQKEKMAEKANKKVRKAVELLADAGHMAEDIGDIYAAGCIDMLVTAVHHAEEIRVPNPVEQEDEA